MLLASYIHTESRPVVKFVREQVKRLSYIHPCHQVKGRIDMNRSGTSFFRKEAIYQYYSSSHCICIRRIHLDSSVINHQQGFHPVARPRSAFEARRRNPSHWPLCWLKDEVVSKCTPVQKQARESPCPHTFRAPRPTTPIVVRVFSTWFVDGGSRLFKE